MFFDHYVIPGVSVNGNRWGKGKEPKGLLCEGEPWVFDYRRTTIPACTISENGERYFALFASDESPLSLQASCSMLPQEDGTMAHRILYPCMERPKTYSGRDEYAPAHEEFLTIGAGETVRTVCFLLSGRPVYPNFAAAAVEDAALELLGSPFSAACPADEVKKLCCAFEGQLLTEVNGRKLFSIGQSLDGQEVFHNVSGYEFGWCGQNGMYARLFLEKGLRTGDQALNDTAVSNLDAWSHEAVEKTGLVHTHYDWMTEKKSDVEDTCNLGYAVLELTKAMPVSWRPRAAPAGFTGTGIFPASCVRPGRWIRTASTRKPAVRCWPEALPCTKATGRTSGWSARKWRAGISAPGCSTMIPFRKRTAISPGTATVPWAGPACLPSIIISIPGARRTRAICTASGEKRARPAI